MCCKVVPIEQDVYDRNKLRLVREVREEIRFTGYDTLDKCEKELITPFTEDGYCPFLNENLSCNIYDDRPSVCKKFGTECYPCMRCAFQDKDGKERSRQQRRSIHRDAKKGFENLLKKDNGVKIIYDETD